MVKTSFVNSLNFWLTDFKELVDSNTLLYVSMYLMGWGLQALYSTRTCTVHQEYEDTIMFLDFYMYLLLVV